MSDTRATEELFYSRYTWCLNPVLTIEDLLKRFSEEIEGFDKLSGWQRDESKANLYLFVCAVACTADDYFAARWLNLSPLQTRLPKWRFWLHHVQRGFDILESAVKVGNLAAWRWRRHWNTCVEQVCQMIICSDPADEVESFEKLRISTPELLRARLPLSLLKRRMRLPEAFRSQDMAHHDVISLIRKFCDSCPDKNELISIMGLRTAGAYFAPLMAEYLKKQGFHRVSWCSIRPKNGASHREQRYLRSIARRNARVLVVDDYPSTGHTLRLTLGILLELGIRPEQIVVLAPTHAAQPNWAELAKINPPMRLFTIQMSELYKNAVLNRHDVERLCAEYYAGPECGEPAVIDDGRVDEINLRLAEHSKDGHHVREKRVFAMEFGGSSRQRKSIFFKSAGWGWLGYHAYIAGKRLDGFVPNVIGMRNGLLLTEWIEDAGAPQHFVGNDGMVKRLASYVATRQRRLALTGDCRLEKRTYRWTGADEILNILRAAYGPYVNRLKLPALRKQLNKYVTAVPTLIDGRMGPDEWLHTAANSFKADFEHHNFGGGELDIVDPAYDLAAGIFEFQLSKEAERDLQRAYEQESGDRSIGERILLYKILYGSTVMKQSLYRINAGRQPHESNARCQYARNFLVYSMNEFCASLLPSPGRPRWSTSLFFMDLDGVFDQELLGFPHATQSGLLSLALLQANNFSVVLNTGRSIQHVRQYCDAYLLCGGIAEFGAVFIDAVNGREIPLIDRVAAEQLQRCRDAIQKLPGVFIDPSYEYSIRAFRYKEEMAQGLEAGEVKALLRSPEFSRLTYICRGPDTHIVQKRTSKAAGLRFVRAHAGALDAPVTAIGDSEHDIGMLKAADFAYAPANCSPLVRALAKQGKCRVLRQKFQSGLLAAVQQQLGKKTNPISQELLGASGNHHPLMQRVLKAADRRLALQALIVLSWWSL